MLNALQGHVPGKLQHRELHDPFYDEFPASKSSRPAGLAALGAGFPPAVKK